MTSFTTLAFGMPGWQELLILGVIGLLIFGKRLPEVGRSIGSAAFVKTLEQKTGRTLSPAQRSRKKGISKLSP